MKNVHEDSDIYDEVGEVAKGSFEVTENSCYGVTNTRVTGAIKGGESASSKKAMVMLFIFVIALLFCTISACVAFTVKIFELQSEITTLETRSVSAIEIKFDMLQEQTAHNYSDIEATFQQFKHNLSQRYSLQIDLDMLQEESIQNFSLLESSTGIQYLNLSRSVFALEIEFNILQEQAAHYFSDFEAIFQQLYHNLSQRYGSLQIDLDMLQQESIQNFSMLESLLRNGLTPSTSAISCTALPPSSPSGYYWVRASNGSAVRVYCDMTRSCGGVTGGWMRVADLDMTNSSHQCPRDFQQRTDAGRRTCIPVISVGCSSVNFSAAEGYSRVCGKIIAYQVGNLFTFGSHRHPTIDSYIDGVSLTHGQPRQHIWSFAAGLDEVGTYPSLNCPCTNSGTAVPPPFVGNDYFCDTGSKQRHQQGLFYNEDPLWDGAGCGPLNTCCSFNNPPWFHKLLPQPTTGDIEMRVCKNGPRSNKDIAIETIELLVQ